MTTPAKAALPYLHTSVGKKIVMAVSGFVVLGSC